MSLDKQIENVIKDSLEHKGYELVQVNIISGSKMAVDISIERIDENPVSIDDCVEASRTISAILDVEDIIKCKYNLNVSSSGEYRPIFSINDFERFCGKEAKLELHSQLNGKKKFFGILVKVEQNALDTVVYLREECDTTEDEIGINYSNIKKTSIRKRFKI